jgi:hypothetical protein
MRLFKIILSFGFLLIMFGCGGTSEVSKISSSSSSLEAYYYDAPVQNIHYECGKYNGYTTASGGFNYEKNKSCALYLGSIKLRDIDTSNLNNYAIIFESDPKVAALLQSLDSNGLSGSNIFIPNEVTDAINELSLSSVPQSDNDRANMIGDINTKLGANGSYSSVSQNDATDNLKSSYTQLNSEEVVFTDTTSPWLVEVGAVAYVSNGMDFSKTSYALMAWSDSGMHCMDEDYSVFSILPPGNTLKAQLVVKGASPRIVNAKVDITYEAADDEGTKNSSSSSKTNFWDYATKLFPSLSSLVIEMGLNGKATQSDTPQLMDYNTSQNLYIAEGIPVVPIDDDNSGDSYPLVKVVAKNKNGDVLASTTTVLPVSTEMNCMGCHDKGSSPKMDIIKQHDNHIPNAVKDNSTELKSKGYNYDDAGLEATVNGGTPILCAACHKDNALKGSGVGNVKSLTEAIHGAHSARTDVSGYTLNDIENRSACYSCHPGESTKCLRGAMGSAKDSNGDNLIDCQSCHGTMEAVAEHAREGWNDEPNCQACHQDGKRYPKAVTDVYKGTLRDAVDTKFATETTVHDTNGSKLYRHSSGHNGMACAACHGTQHAIYPSSLPKDNKQSIELQGYAGTIRECGVCHGNDSSPTVHNGPHGIHTIGQKWVDMHGSIALKSGDDSCKVCHGTDLKGTDLSKVGTKRVFKLGVMSSYKEYSAGDKVGCFDCHK